MHGWLTALADLGRAFMRRLARLLVRFSVSPDAPSATGAAVCYVLENDRYFDQLVLDEACRRHGLPAASAPLRVPGLSERRSVFGLRRFRGLWRRRVDPLPSRRLERLIGAIREDPTLEIVVVPVAVFWGRAPVREQSWLKLLFAEQWDLAGRTRRALAILLHGRHVLVNFGDPLPLRSLCPAQLEHERCVRRAGRLLRVHFRRARTAVIGPDLSHRRSLVARILEAPPVRQAIEDEHAATGERPERVHARARDYAHEIAADYSYAVVLFFDRLLTWLWTRLYDGMRLHGVERLRELARDHELVYVPCHRSHVDYLALSYVLYKHGLATPYIAAGINLNMPVIGPLLRRGGAFFLRRSFRGNALYTAVFRCYLAELLSRGYPIEYFIEGTRSRTGRLLPFRTGMLSMTVHGYLCAPSRPVVFVPVYLGYEKLVEGQTYISELRGQPKRKESLGSLLRAVRALRERFGTLHVSVGEPVHLPRLLDACHPEWRANEYRLQTRPAWLGEVVDRLGREILTRINAAAAVNPVNLVATALLAMPKQAMVERELAAQLDLYARLLARPPWSLDARLPGMDGAQMIRYAELLRMVERRRHELGDIIRMDERRAVLATYFRNNVQHLLALAGLVACCYLNHRTLGTERLRRLIALVYPYVAVELSLPWTLRKLQQALDDTLAAMADVGLLRSARNGQIWRRAAAGSTSAAQLVVLAHTMMPTLQRYYLVVALLTRNGSGRLRRPQLLDLAQKVAERLSLVYELHSPDYFDRAPFAAFVDGLRERGLVRVDADQRLHFDHRLAAGDEDARQVLGAQIRHSLLQVAAVSRAQPAALPPPEQAPGD